MRGLLWSHLLASVCGGLALAGVLLAFGVIGKQRTTTVPINYSQPPSDAGGSAQADDTEQIYDANQPGVVFIKAAITQRVTSPFIAGSETSASTSTGSGVLIASRRDDGHDVGYILTTFHTIEGSDLDSGITVEFNHNSRRRAKVVDYSQSFDIALLSVDMEGVPTTITPLHLGDSLSVSVGDSLLAIANPFGSDRTLSSGIVSSLAGELTAIDGTSIDSVIQTDIPASPGASGGPLLNVDGQVIGITDQIQVASGGTSYLVGFAIPINTAKSYIPKGIL
jgi:S1-C subfamily serine protease